MNELTCTDKQWAAYRLNKQGDETYAQYDARICKVVAPPFPVDGNHRLPGSAIEACVALPMMPVDQEFSDKVDEMMAEKTKGTNRRSFKALEEENAELRAEIERLKGGNDGR